MSASYPRINRYKCSILRAREEWRRKFFSVLGRILPTIFLDDIISTFQKRNKYEFLDVSMLLW